MSELVSVGTAEARIPALNITVKNIICIPNLGENLAGIP